MLKDGPSIGKIRRGKVLFGKDGRAQPNIIRYLDEVAGLVPWTWWPHEDAGNTDEAKKEILDIFGKDVFPSPKPSKLVKRLLLMYTGGDDLVLDSFAGSGTTGEAVLKLNKEDGGNRRFVLDQMQEDAPGGSINIAREVTRTRVERVVEGYRPSGSKESVPGVPGAFTYARIGKPLLGEHRDWGETLPAWLDLGRYVFYTETSHELNPKGCDEATGYLGEYGGTSYYLLYSPKTKGDRALDKAFLAVLRKDRRKRKVVYCEKVWVYRDDLAGLRAQIGEVRPMLLPFQVK